LRLILRKYSKQPVDRLQPEEVMVPNQPPVSAPAEKIDQVQQVSGNGTQYRWNHYQRENTKENHAHKLSAK